MFDAPVGGHRNTSTRQPHCNFDLVAVNRDYKFRCPKIKKNKSYACHRSILNVTASALKQKPLRRKLDSFFVALFLAFKNYDHTNITHYHNGLKFKHWNCTEHMIASHPFDTFGLK